MIKDILNSVGSMKKSFSSDGNFHLLPLSIHIIHYVPYHPPDIGGASRQIPWLTELQVTGGGTMFLPRRPIHGNRVMGQSITPILGYILKKYRIYLNWEICGGCATTALYLLDALICPQS